MNPEIGKAGFRIAIFLVLTTLGMLFFLQPGTPEFSITLITLIIGLLFAGVIIVIVRLGSR